MRLFISININRENKEILDSIVRDLQGKIIRGRSVARENHHLTLAFIGESKQIDLLKGCIDAAAAEDFWLIAAKLNRFRRREGDIIILDIKPEKQLFDLQTRLIRQLTASRISAGKQALLSSSDSVSQAVLPQGFDFRAYTVQMPHVAQMAGRISLMKSEHLEGKLIYTEIYGRNLSQENQ